MEVKIKNKVVEVKFTYLSFKNMSDLSISDMTELEEYPFKIITTAEKLLYGGLNHSSKFKVTRDQVSQFLEHLIEDEEQSLPDFLGDLMAELEKSGFFKHLQKNPQD